MGKSPNSWLLLFACIGCAASGTGTSPAQSSTPHTRKVAASAATALDSLSNVAEKSYRAALVRPVQERQSASFPIESALARRDLTELEVALTEAPSEHPLDRAARRFATAAEALLLRLWGPARRAGERDVAKSASLESLLATHDVFQQAATQLRLELERAVRSSTVLEAMRTDNSRGAD